MAVVCPEELRDVYSSGRLIPFIGAGVSMSVKWREHAGAEEKRGPSWSELVDEAARKLGFSEPASYAFAAQTCRSWNISILRKLGFTP